MPPRFLLHVGGKLLVLLMGLATSSTTLADESLRNLFDTMFDPTRAAPQKTMGLLQRDFIDLASASHENLQIAFVVDGTESMANQLDAVRSMMSRVVEDLNRLNPGRIEYALVVYRDAKSPSGDVTLALPDFTDNKATFLAAMESLVPESGAPYFHEVPDAAIHAALSQLAWTDAKDASRWIFLIADAPPYQPDFVEEQFEARRRYDTEVLVGLANRRGVTINTILCESDKKEFAAYTKCLPDTRRFMNELSSGTGGLMLDLSYEDVRQAIGAAAEQPRVELTQIVPISYQEVAVARPEQQSVSLAVLPFITAAASSADVRPQIESRLTEDGLLSMEGDEFTFATELRFKLQNLPGVRVKSPGAVERQIASLRNVPGGLDVYLRRLADRLGVDYLLYGLHVRQGEGISIRSAVFVRDTGRQLNSPSLSLTSGGSANESVMQVATRERDVISFAVTQIAEDRQQRQVAGEPLGVAGEIASDASYAGLDQPISTHPLARRDFLQATVFLERALEFPAGDPAGMKALEQAQRRLDAGLKHDESNPIGNSLDAYCAFNQAQQWMRSGKSAEARAAVQRGRKSLNRAHRESAKAPSRWIETEINADFYLMSAKPDVARAMELYQSIVSASAASPDFLKLRAHWMLAGIYAGDWGVPEQFVDPAKAREHVVRILAEWPDSHQAIALKQLMRWDDQSGTNFAFVPKSHAFLSMR